MFHGNSPTEERSWLTDKAFVHQCRRAEIHRGVGFDESVIFINMVGIAVNYGSCLIAR